MQFTFNITTPKEFMFGLMANVVAMQWWICKPMIVETGLDLGDPEMARFAAETVLNLVLERFGDSQARRDLEPLREQFIGFILEMVSKPEPTPPATGRHLRLVP